MVIAFVLFISKKLMDIKKRSFYHSRGREGHSPSVRRRSVKANSVDEITRSMTAEYLPTE